MRKKVIISVSSDLCTDQRVQKVAQSLHDAGFDVLLLGRRKKNSGFCEANYPFKRLKLCFEKGFLFYAELNLRLFFLLLTSKVDILLANDTDTLTPNFLVAKIRNKKLVFDAHELFPEVPEVTNRKFVKACWTLIEKTLFPHIKNAYTVCQSIADYYKNAYGINMSVIRNMPYANTIIPEPKLNYPGKKIILYQGAVNVGRGLEWVIDCMPLIDDAVLVIIGKGDMYRKLKARVKHKGLEDKVHFLGKIAPQELPAYTCSANLGLCLLEKNGLSYYYSLPNRIFDYMRSGVPILATDFPEIAKIVGEYKTGKLISHYEPEYLANVIKDLLHTWNNEEREKLIKLSNNFCWELEELKLLAIFESL